jgi:hypothetical protein
MAPNENLTAVLHGVEDLRLENYDVPEIKDNGEELIFKNEQKVFDEYFKIFRGSS